MSGLNKEESQYFTWGINYRFKYKMEKISDFSEKIEVEVPNGNVKISHFGK